MLLRHFVTTLTICATGFVWSSCYCGKDFSSLSPAAKKIVMSAGVYEDARSFADGYTQRVDDMSTTASKNEDTSTIKITQSVLDEINDYLEGLKASPDTSEESQILTQSDHDNLLKEVSAEGTPSALSDNKKKESQVREELKNENPFSTMPNGEKAAQQYFHAVKSIWEDEVAKAEASTGASSQGSLVIKSIVPKGEDAPYVGPKDESESVDTWVNTFLREDFLQNIPQSCHGESRARLLRHAIELLKEKDPALLSKHAKFVTAFDNVNPYQVFEEMGV